MTAFDSGANSVLARSPKVIFPFVNHHAIPPNINIDLLVNMSTIIIIFKQKYQFSYTKKVKLMIGDLVKPKSKKILVSISY